MSAPRAAVACLCGLTLAACSTGTDPEATTENPPSTSTAATPTPLPPAADLILGEADGPEGYTYSYGRTFYTQDSDDPEVLVEFLKRQSALTVADPPECAGFYPNGAETMILLGEHEEQVESVDYFSPGPEGNGIAIVLDTGENLSVPERAGCEEFTLTIGDEMSLVFSVEDFEFPAVDGFDMETAVRVTPTSTELGGEQIDPSQSSPVSYLVAGRVGDVRLQFTAMGDEAATHLNSLVGRQVAKIRST